MPRYEVINFDNIDVDINGSFTFKFKTNHCIYQCIALFRPERFGTRGFQARVMSNALAYINKEKVLMMIGVE